MLSAKAPSAAPQKSRGPKSARTRERSTSAGTFLQSGSVAAEDVPAAARNDTAGRSSPSWRSNELAPILGSLTITQPWPTWPT